MTKISQPDVTVNIIGANVVAANAAQAVLLLAQKLPGGSAVAGDLYRDVQDSTIRTLAGAGSQAADGYLGFRTINPVTPVDCIFLDDPLGGASVGTLLWAGTATENGDFTITVGSERNGKAVVSVLTGDAGADIATKVATAYTSLTDCIATVDVNGGTPEQNDVTVNNAGTEGDSLGIKIEGSVAGVTYTLTGATGGSGVPALTGVFDVVGEKRYQTIIQPGTYGTANLTTFLNPRWNVNNNVQDGVGIVTLADTKGNHITALNALNSQNLIYGCESLESIADYKGPGILENLYARSCMIGALRSLRLTDGANITEYVNASGGPNDSIGGSAIASLPYFNSPLPLPIMDETFGFTNTELEEIKTAGGFLVGNNTANNQIILGEVPTTYKTDSAGNADPSFKYLNYVDTSSQVREFMFNNFKKDCAQSRLTEGDLLPNRNMNNAGSIRAKALRYYGILSGPDYVLLQAGEDARKFFANSLEVTLDLVDGSVLLNMKVPIITQLRTIVVPMQIAFSVL